jgi:dipeptidyl aminopeptidase/acylaminoacyl peptidase
LDDNTLIDLQTNKSTTLAWNLEYYPKDMFSDLFWTSDETRIYRCCYFYADLTTGTSYSSTRSDFQDINDNQREPWGLVYPGGWIQNDTYFLPEWNWLDYGDIRQLPMLDPAKKRVVEVRAEAGIPEDWSCTDIEVSPDGKYVWMTGFGDSYLVDLTTFKAQYYPHEIYPYVNWSPNSKFALLSNNNDSYSILSVIDKKLSPVPVTPQWEWINWWHTRDNILIYPSKDKNAPILLDVSTLSFRELPFKVEGGGYDSFVWSPNGEKIAFIAEDNSLWQVDYPKLENLEQLTQPLPDVHDVNWSPDGNSIAFISGSDIYIVDTIK